MEDRINVHTELFQWLNQQTDLSSYQVDLVDGFVFMLKKIKRHKLIRLTRKGELHPRFWKSHDRTFGYQLMKGKKQQTAHLYRFYVDVAMAEQLLVANGDRIQLTDKGDEYLKLSADGQLDLLFRHIW
ncbi:hypothetical protein [Halalkalibacterium ligniniphilum]|uniref:hypothetical protein n=1 Tax=Halalkalibacterium ligniniphilum TaxID=1134413 RepID=UPI00034BBD8C|nr:hypothetical protein [Halalkalibacterium ligniniphilum]